MVFQGKAKAPIFFITEIDLKNYVKSTESAIGIISLNAVDDQTTIVQMEGAEGF